MRWNPWFPTTGPRDVPVDPSRFFFLAHCCPAGVSFKTPKLGWLKINKTYPLVNVYISMEIHHFFMGKSTMSMAIFNSKLLVITRGYQLRIHEPRLKILDIPRRRKHYFWGAQFSFSSADVLCEVPYDPQLQMSLSSESRNGEHRFLGTLW